MCSGKEGILEGKNSNWVYEKGLRFEDQLGEGCWTGGIKEQD